MRGDSMEMSSRAVRSIVASLAILSVAVAASGCDNAESGDGADASREQRIAEFVSADAGGSLRPPRSTSVVPPPDSGVTVTVTTREIFVDGERVLDRPVQPKDKRGGKNGRQMIPVFNALNKVRSQGQKPAESVNFVLDGTVPARRITELMYTAGQTGLVRQELVVSGREGTKGRAIKPHVPTLSPPKYPSRHGYRYLGHLSHHSVGDLPKRKPSGPGHGATRADVGNGNQKTENRPPRPNAGGSSAGAEQKSEKESLNLTIIVTQDGFQVTTRNGRVATVEGCPGGGPTICLPDGAVDVGQKIDELRSAMQTPDEMDPERARQLSEQIVEAYDWRRLYNEVAELSREAGTKAGPVDDTVVKVAMGPNVPYAVLVRVLDVVRFRLGRDQFEEDEAFHRAFWEKPVPKVRKGNMYVPEPLFSDPVLTIVR